jgi:signal transduction histidine kinase
LRSFLEAGGRALRAADMLAHDGESDVFLAALAAPPRDREGITAADCRAALARLASAMERAAGVEIESGWVIAGNAVANDPRLASTVRAALERGAQERERYAFFSAVGHELRTPLTSIRGYLDTLLGDTFDARTARRFLEIAHAEAVRLGRLVDGMFALSVLDLQEAGVGREAATCDVARVVRAAIDAAAPVAAASSVLLLVREVTRDGESVSVAMGFDRLAHIVGNLLDNALKHGAPGGRVEVSIQRSVDGRYAEVCVEDDGPGVPSAEREAIFVLGARGTHAASAGTGIGLAVARLIAERAGGEIAVEDSQLGGALFRARAPLVAAGEVTA